MPLPLLIIGAAAAATTIGAKKAYDGHKDKSRADDIIEESKKIYRKKKEDFDVINNQVSQELESLGEFELKIGSDFDKFDRLVEEILKNNNFQKFGNTKVNIPKHKLNQIKDVAISATDYLKTVVGGGVSGAATGFAVYGGVMVLGAASTGTPIATLSGVAAYNATMAAIGGGSLAAGGWGMAGGAMVLGGAVVAPVLAVAGIAYAMHGSKALENAIDVKKEVELAVLKMTVAKDQLIRVQRYSSSIKLHLETIYTIFSLYFEKLKDVNEIVKQGDEAKIRAISEEANLYIQNGISLAAIMAKLISTPLFKVKKDKDGKVFTDDHGVPEIMTDKDGMQVLDIEGLEEALKQTGQNFKDSNLGS
ncbi:chemotaxis protein [Acinetobacter bereziniae]|uniref:chemotaxis protein n=1 Tax=Acinetobacter bereziniae TaxID=106648 RepID=UPI00225B9A6C|nr:chemotaxis protein [Acinetobacter bereziniae]